MKFLKITFLSLLLAFNSCGSDDDATVVEEETNITYQFQDNLEIVDLPIEIMESESDNNQIVNEPFDYFTIQEGAYIIFRYREVLPDNPDIADDEITKELLFQIDNTLETFTFNDEELKELPVLYSTLCFCDIRPFKISSGRISGIKNNENSWDIAIQVVLENGTELVVNNNFTASQIYTP